MGDNFAYGLGYIAQFLGAVGAQILHVARGAYRVMNHRPFAGQELEIEPHAFQRQKQVGKDDGRIHVKLFRGGDGHLGGQLGILADLQQGVVAAYGLVLRHIAAGLAQEPHRGLVHWLAQAGAQKAAAGGETGTQFRGDVLQYGFF